MKRIVIAGAAAALVAAGAALAQTAWPQTWEAKAAPYRLIGDVYEVGSEGLTALLITTPRGHVLLDAGMPRYAPAGGQEHRGARLQAG